MKSELPSSFAPPADASYRRIVSAVRLAVASPFIVAGALLLFAGYALTYLAELIAGRTV